jgi:hypothetical protein
LPLGLLTGALKIFNPLFRCKIMQSKQQLKKVQKQKQRPIKKPITGEASPQKLFLMPPHKYRPPDGFAYHTNRAHARFNRKPYPTYTFTLAASSFCPHSTKTTFN